MRIASIGEILWDVLPDGERQIEHLGGAPFNFAVNAYRAGHDVRFISAVGNDQRGRRALAEIARLGLDPQFVATVPDAPTGVVSVEFDPQGEPRYTMHRPAAYDFLRAPENLSVDWIYFGTLLQINAAARSETMKLLNSSSARRFYDVNLRPDQYTLDLVRWLLKMANVVKVNEGEAREIGLTLDSRGFDAICITRAKDGCRVRIGDESFDAPGIPVTGGDPVGAGDAFAAAFLHGLDAGWPARRIAEFANRAGAEAAQRSGAL